MRIANELIDKLATLARLEFDAEEKDEIRNDLEEMVQMMDKIKEVDVEGVDPMVSPIRESELPQNKMTDSELTQQQIIDNAPETENGYIKVPLMVRKGFSNQ